MGNTHTQHKMHKVSSERVWGDRRVFLHPSPSRQPGATTIIRVYFSSKESEGTQPYTELGSCVTSQLGPGLRQILFRARLHHILTQSPDTSRICPLGLLR